ncbi:hypothetical protein [Leisingera sp.]|uniref:hypothetical protein n=1 Tax=Leisingera sp. TaxID=1879318 RepID=UPI003A8EB010
MKKLWSYIAEDDGTITVDWVILCAAAIGLAVLIAGATQDGALGLAQGLANFMSNWNFG